MQQTDEATIADEQKLVRELVGLSDDVEITFTDFGWSSRVHIVNYGEIVFKFPRSEQVKEEYALEIPAYKIARKIGGLFVPEIKWKHPDNNYLGYQGVIGEPLDKVIPTLSSDEKYAIGTQLGTFLKEFHERTLTGAPIISPQREIATYKRKLEDALPDIRRFFSETEVGQIRRLIEEEYPRKMLELGFTKGLCHGDLGTWNMIYGTDGQVGIIDFGSVGYYDVSRDFAGITDEHMLSAALESYGRDVSREKIALRMKVLPVFDISFFVDKNDQAGIDMTIEQIRKTVL